jgi:hypothetical protein
VQARALAALSGRLPDALTVDVVFQKPLYLPATVDFATTPTDAGWDFGVRNTASGAHHLAGTVRRH